MGDGISEGDHVEWNTPQGTTSGEVVEELTSETTIEGHEAKASEDDPQYRVRSDTTGAEAAHKPSALKKIPKSS
jgi:hypothetical protein